VPSARLQEAGAGGQDGLLAKLYEGFLLHRQQARDSVRESIDVRAVEIERQTQRVSNNSIYAFIKRERKREREREGEGGRERHREGGGWQGEAVRPC